jgi:hypothetical protein
LGILYFILCGLFKYVVVSRDYAHAQQFIMETEERQLPLRTVLQHYELEEQILGAWCKQAGRDERLRRGLRPVASEGRNPPRRQEGCDERV